MEHFPQLGAGTRKAIVECTGGRTVCGIISPFNDDEALATAMPKAATLYRHEHEHPGCDTEPLWSSHGLQGIRSMVDQQWDAMVAHALKELAN